MTTIVISDTFLTKVRYQLAFPCISTFAVHLLCLWIDFALPVTGFYEEWLSRKIDVSQGTGQDSILAPFMYQYQVYVNGLLNVLSNHYYAILINGLRVPSPLFADDISLLMFHPSFLKTPFGLYGSLPWLQNTDSAICCICKEDIESMTHFFSTAVISETILNLSGIN